MGKTYTPPPERPRGMSQKEYRERYDSDPVTVVYGDVRARCAGAVSAEIVKATLERQGHRDVRIEPAA